MGWAALFGADSGGSAVTAFTAVTIFLSVMIGGVTFSGSIIAWAKLAEVMPSGAVVFAAQRFINGAILGGLVVCGVFFALEPAPDSYLFYAILGLALLLGIMAVIPIGGADMPVVISLLNSYSGLAACAAGFAINNNILIVSGSLVGAAGIILTNIMCKAMNRSLTNVLFSGFGAVKTATKVEGEVRPIASDDAYLILEAASSVTFVPGYGMAVAQAQHVVRELGEILEANGCEVSYAIHPVAGRMPGHMNVLLAEANVPYDQLVEADDINPRMPNVDVAVVIGANDVVNPAARDDEASPIYGMPIINVDHARTVFVLKRSMASGFRRRRQPALLRYQHADVVRRCQGVDLGADLGVQIVRIPEALFPALNPLMRILLNSPLHRLMSGSVMIIYFTGRKTGKRRATPVRYLKESDACVVCLTGRRNQVVAEFPGTARRGTAVGRSAPCGPGPCPPERHRAQVVGASGNAEAISGRCALPWNRRQAGAGADAGAVRGGRGPGRGGIVRREQQAVITAAGGSKISRRSAPGGTHRVQPARIARPTVRARRRRRRSRRCRPLHRRPYPDQAGGTAQLSGHRPFPLPVRAARRVLPPVLLRYGPGGDAVQPGRAQLGLPGRQG